MEPDCVIQTETCPESRTKCEEVLIILDSNVKTKTVRPIEGCSSRTSNEGVNDVIIFKEVVTLGDMKTTTEDANITGAEDALGVQRSIAPSSETVEETASDLPLEDLTMETELPEDDCVVTKISKQTSETGMDVQQITKDKVIAMDVDSSMSGRHERRTSGCDLEILFDASNGRRGKQIPPPTENQKVGPWQKYCCTTYPEISRIAKPFKSNILKGCKWSPDGSCLLTNCADNTLRLFDLPSVFYTKNWGQSSPTPGDFEELRVSLTAKEGGLVYDYAWYPTMSSADPSTCCFLSTSAGSPVHLWDAYTGKVEATYRGYNYADEVMSAMSVSFNCSGDKVLCGYRNQVKIFKTNLPGRDSTSIDIKGKANLRGLVSCIAPNPHLRQMFAIGTYRKAIGLFTEDGLHVCSLLGHRGGITHLRFSSDGSRLYSGGRKDNEILCWDLRRPGTVLSSMPRTVGTNQRIYFDLTPSDDCLLSGNTDGNLSIWDLGPMSKRTKSNEMELKPALQFRTHEDCTNGCSVNPKFSLLATASGKWHASDQIRTVDLTGTSSSSSEEDEEVISKFQCRPGRNPSKQNSKREACIKLWWMGGRRSQVVGE